ncbi:MAG: lipid II flippase MurJ, partial [Thermoplasmata archaeon]
MIKKQSFRQAFLLLISVALLSKGLGLLREVALAGVLGASAFTDHFLIAWIVPAILGNLIASVLATSLIPTLLGEYVDTRRLFSFMVLFLFLLSLLVLIFSPQLVGVLAPGYAGEAKRETLLFLRGLVPAFFFLTTAGLFTGYLYSEKQFLWPSLSTILFNGSLVLGLLFLGKALPFQALILGANFGAFLFCTTLFLIWLPRGRKSQRQDWEKTWNQLKGYLSLVISIMVASGASYFNRIIDKVFASFLQPGDISHLHFGARVMWIPIEIFILALGTSLFPFLSEKAQKGDNEGMRKSITEGVKWAWVTVIPASLMLIFFAEPVISLVYGRASFGIRSIKATSPVLSFYSIGIFAIAGNAILFKSLFATKAKKLLIKTAFLSILSNVIFDWLLMRPMGISGIALSTSFVEILTFFYIT